MARNISYFGFALTMGGCLLIIFAHAYEAGGIGVVLGIGLWAVARHFIKPLEPTKPLPDTAEVMVTRSGSEDASEVVNRLDPAWKSWLMQEMRGQKNRDGE